MLLGCLVGPITGAAIGIVFVWLIFLPLEAHFDPDGYNYGAIYQMLFILCAFAAFGSLGGFIAHARRGRRAAKQPQARDIQQAPLDDKTWPPPPAPPAA